MRLTADEAHEERRPRSRLAIMVPLLRVESAVVRQGTRASPRRAPATTSVSAGSFGTLCERRRQRKREGKPSDCVRFSLFDLVFQGVAVPVLVRVEFTAFRELRCMYCGFRIYRTRRRENVRAVLAEVLASKTKTSGVRCCTNQVTDSNERALGVCVVSRLNGAELGV